MPYLKAPNGSLTGAAHPTGKKAGAVSAELRRWAGVAACAVSTLALSAGTALASAAEHGGGHSAGLPQLDPSTFPPQLVWLAITFGSLYYLMAKVALPRVSEVLEARQERITVDLEKATAYKDESTTVIAAYEQALADAQAQAQVVIGETVAQSEATAAARQAEFMADLSTRIKAIEARIQDARATALANVQNVAVDVAQDVVLRVAGLSVDKSKAEKAVAAVQGKETV